MNKFDDAGQEGLVSIVIPSYNHALYLAQCMDSALNQTYADVEVVVVDDGSTDASREWLLRYEGHPRVRVFLQENAGAHAAINRGVSLARGEYIAILNSDDVYMPNRVERLLQEARKRAGPALLFSTVQAIDENGQPHPADFGWNRMVADMFARWRSDPSRIDSLAFGNLAISTSNFFFRRDLWPLTGPFKSYRFVHDWEFVLRTARLGPEFWALIDEPLLQYRLHGKNTILGGVEKNHAEAIHIVREELHLRAPQLTWALRREQYLTNYLRKYGNLRREAHANEVRVHGERQLAEVQGKLGEVRLEVEKGKAELEQVAGHLAATQELHRNLRSRAAQWRSSERLLRRSLRHGQKELIRLEQVIQQLQGQSNQHAAEAAHWLSHAQQLRDALDETHRSHSWRVTAPLRRAARWLRYGKRAMKMVADARSRLGGWPAVVRHGAQFLRKGGLNGVRARLVAPHQHPGQPGVPQPAGSPDPYQQWVDQQDARVARLRERRDAIVAELRQRPLFSVVVPVYNTPEPMLREMLESVVGQLYPEWELCIADDASSQPHVREVLMEYSAREPRLRIDWRPINGNICAATNSALEMARGDYVVLLDHDDVLAPHALLSMAQWIDQHPDASVIYSDEDKIDVQRRRMLPFFKPDWSPALLTVQNYVGHLLCVRRTLMQEVGGLREGFDGSQDYDLVLRLSRAAGGFSHLPDVLYHWRRHEASTSLNSQAKPAAHGAGARALAEHLAARYGDQFLHVGDGSHAFLYDARFKLPVGMKVSIIIPTRNRADLLDACVRSILTRSTFQNYEIIILDNQSDEEDSLAYLRQVPATDGRIRVVEANFPFNCPYLNNYALDHCSGEVLVFLNNDTEVISPDWMERLSEWALLPDVATVGPMLLYEDGTIQHAGVVVGMGGWADHVFKAQRPEHYPSPFVSSVTSRNVLAVTGACVAIERTKFEQMGRFDEMFQVCGSDVEIGIRAHKQGLQNVYLATTQLYHLESKTRDPRAVPEVDFVQSDLKYAPYRLGHDPFYNRNLSRNLSTPTPSTESQGGEL